MPVHVLPDSAAVASRAADLLCGVVAAKPRAILGLPTGGTPVPLYEELNRRANGNDCDFSAAVAYAIDEFCSAQRTTPGTNTHFYGEHLRLPLRALHCPNPAATEPELHIQAYAQAIRRGGGLDCCVLGIGATGHIAFNEPGSARDSRARVVELTDVSRSAHAANFGGIDRVPLRGMTLGITDLMESEAIVVLATGSRKAGIVRVALEDQVGPRTPASFLRDHANVTWLLDAAAAAQLARS